MTTFYTHDVVYTGAQWSPSLVNVRVLNCGLIIRWQCVSVCLSVRLVCKITHNGVLEFRWNLRWRLLNLWEINNLIHDLLFLPISTSVWSEITCCNSLFHSRLTCSRFTGRIQPSINNPDTANLNTISHHFKKNATIKEYNQQYISIYI